MTDQQESRPSGRMVLSLLCLLVAALLLGCPQSETQDTQQEGLEEGALEEGDTDVDEGDLEEDAALSDRGEPCRTRRYLLFPGSSETLTFEDRLTERQQTEVIPEDLEIGDDQWEAADFMVSLGYCRIETVTETLSRWVVDGREYYDLALSRDIAPSTLTIGHIDIRWNPDGFGTITKIGRYNLPAEVNRLSAEVITEMLGGETALEYTDPDTQNSWLWEVVPQTVEREVAILVMELSVDAPAQFKDTGELKLEVGNDTDSWTFDLQPSDLQDVFLVSGPGERPDCFSDDAL